LYQRDLESDDSSCHQVQLSERERERQEAEQMLGGFLLGIVWKTGDQMDYGWNSCSDEYRERKRERQRERETKRVKVR